ncbi:transmembrane protein 272-like [Saccoglossus kowalevskii]|uniref:Uncharacterized protein LOC100373930 n=1 Tax=Saccoglossus kowalevskii TaxID=10224 RepID=A0ABM0GUR0_SACKO|nr:PREDICTED: uncharacterized protein LOC100373930 [Saccoglossus kowalevskii]
MDAANESQDIEAPQDKPPTHEEPQKGDPPKYGSIVSEIKKAKRESCGNKEFIKHVMAIISRSGERSTWSERVVTKMKKSLQESRENKEYLTLLCFPVMLMIGCVICISIFIAAPIAMIVIGAIYKDECNAQPYIPIYLIVGGSFSLFSCFISGGKSRSNRCQTNEEDPQKDECTCRSCISGLVSIFQVCWFIAGNVWIYKAYEPSYEDPTSADYCDKTLYLFSFWLMNVSYMLIGVGFCVCLLVIYCVYCREPCDDEE